VPTSPPAKVPDEIANALVRDSADAIAAFDRGLRLAAWNPAMEAFSGVPASQVVGRAIREVVASHGAAVAFAAQWPLERVLAGETLTADGLLHAGAGGVPRYADWRYAPVRDAEGAVSFGLAVGRDVTARHEVDRRAAELDAVFRALNDRCVRVDTDGLIIRLLAGYPAYVPPNQVEGKRVRQILEPADASRVEEALAALKERRVPVTVEYDVERADGRHHLEARLVPFLEREAIAVLRDVSDRHRAEAALHESEERLRAAQKMEAIGRLAGGVAHDFNNLLTVLINCADLMARTTPAESPAAPYLAEVRGAVQRGASLTQQLLAFSRRQPTQLRVFELNAVVREVQTMLARLIGEHIQLVTELDARAGRVRADRGQIEQVVVNLVVNARDSIGDRGGRIVVATQAREVSDTAEGLTPGAYAALLVKDNGAGMSADVQAHAFEPFFTTKPHGRGTGLGLATVYGIAKQSRGQVTVRSAPGEGAEFEVLLPAVRAASSESVAPPRPAAAPRGDETILLVEDEPTLRRIVVEVLADSGYRVRAAANGEEALRICDDALSRDEPPHLLVSDVVMPGMGGRELAARVRRRCPRARVLLMSGYDEDAEGGEGEPMIGKPFTASELARRVREVLDSGG
jgi:PAS domain S-box-containing protein